MSENILSQEIENRLGFLHLKACAVTDIGRRQNNEDSFLINEKTGLFIVADGMGGHELGEYASYFASQKVEKIITLLEEFVATSREGAATFLPFLQGGSGRSPYDAYLNFAISLANKELKEESSARGVEKSMGTTLAAALFKGRKVYIANVGDSRVYKISMGTLNQITHDHSLVARRVRMGEISTEEAKTAKGRNVITKCIGVKDIVEADIYAITVYPKERFLLCTDGLSNVVHEKEITRYATMESVEHGCKGLVSLARDLGGRDNITAILIEVVGVDEGAGGRENITPVEQEKTL